MENNKKIEKIESFMTKNVMSVQPDTPITEAVEVIIKNNFNGLPVIDRNYKVVGMLTELELMLEGSSMHLPTLLKLLGNFEVYGKDEKFIKNDLKKMIALKTKDIMNENPVILKTTDGIYDAINAFCKYRETNPMPVVDENGKLVGIISRYDIVRFFRQAPVGMPEMKNDRQVDQRVDLFLKNFEKNFLFVSKTRTHHWFIYSLIFALLGFAVAFLVIIRINSQ